VFPAAEREAELSVRGREFAALRIAYNEAVRTKAPDRQQKEDALIQAVVAYALAVLDIELVSFFACLDYPSITPTSSAGCETPVEKVSSLS
jgi:hypothetical protein